ncbi:glycerophosphodiester phosphodiesterase family protein [Leucobacter luti]|uniref:glycerophosphodiester phosphodiesterase n=1 Tax=Leucobacter luti TaxID=340320 RepID=A0A4V6MCW7_9MICO|nr:glycerophosphodiester phosphodiesterase family protein [Leucobacter luti]MBL3698634.1 glycerophosphodiester phosphodiesterase [Leucobacter luti]RZT66009.1 glycerophosphoryl diester phosphodiesterase [Leucobacter luti]
MSQRAAGGPLIIGHRGAPGYRPEHSAAAYRLAFELGADAVEPDIVVTRDGVLVVRHENEISGTTNVADHPEFRSRRTTKTVDGKKHTGWFTEDFTWAELSTLRCRERLARVRPDNREFNDTEPILRLRDVLRIVEEAGEAGTQTPRVVIEIKHAHFLLQQGHDIGALLIAELAATGWNERPDQLIIESFELGVLESLSRARVRATLVFLTERFGTPPDEPRPGRPTRSYGWYRSDDGLAFLAQRVDGISVAKGNLIRVNALGRATGPTDLVARAHARGLLVFTWTLRPENRYLNVRFQSSLRGAEWGDWQSEFGLVVDSGVDGIFVDHPDLGVAIRDAGA